MARARADIDYESFAADYCAGHLTVRQIADKYGIGTGSVRRSAERLKLTRDLSAKIEAATQQKVISARIETAQTDAAHIGTKEAQIIESESTIRAKVLGSHFQVSEKIRNQVIAMTSELELAAGLELGEELENSLPSDIKRAIRSAVTLDSRSKILVRLTESAQRVIDIERKHFGMDRAEIPPDPLKAMPTDKLQSILAYLLPQIGGTFEPKGRVLEHGQ